MNSMVKGACSERGSGRTAQRDRILPCDRGALVSVSAIVLDEGPQRMWEFVVGSWWLLGVIMQIGAGLIVCLRLANKAAG
jgi:hypothetical protein